MTDIQLIGCLVLVTTLFFIDVIIGASNSLLLIKGGSIIALVIMGIIMWLIYKEGARRNNQ